MKLGVVMEGGASRTIFSCGVTDVFMDENIYPDYLIGVSAGIAYGVSYASAQRGRNAEFTRKYMGERRYMGLHHFLDPRKRCYYNLDFAFDEIPNRLVPFDYQALADYPGKVVAVVTNIATGEAEYFDIPPYETRWETTIASCSLPVLFTPVELDGNRYLDGGLADPVPYRKAMEEGCDRIIVILTREREYIKGKENGSGIVNLVYRKYPQVVELMKRRADSYNQLTQELLEEEKKGNIFLIAPRETFGVGRTEGRWELLEKLYQEGIDVAREQIAALKEYIE
ncbi:MAG: patatin family protein [Clostridiales bacterium]|nr:patatin family protein [Clostridiales bacterium]